MGKRQPPSRNTQKPNQEPTESDQPGLVLAHFGQVSLVEDEQGEIIRCATRKKLSRTVSGDRILWQGKGSQDGVITHILDRKTSLVRPDQNGRARPVAANVDRIVVVIASKPSFEYRMVDHYLVAGELIGAQPIIVVNKCDLLDDESRSKLEQKLGLYEQIGYPLIFTSTLTSDGLSQLEQQLDDHTSVLVGQSGVGKSSLVQAILPDIEIRTGELSKVTGLGRHTTTVAMLYHLQGGGDLIDSPGVREFSLSPVPASELAYGFAEFRPYLGQCKFHNCIHHREPGCAIQEAVREGAIDKTRMKNYQSLVNSMSEAN